MILNNYLVGISIVLDLIYWWSSPGFSGQVLPNIRYMLDDLAGGLMERIRAMVQQGLKLRVAFDNLSRENIYW